jgi:hypothetical protein
MSLTRPDDSWWPEQTSWDGNVTQTFFFMVQADQQVSSLATVSPQAVFSVIREPTCALAEKGRA